MPDDGMEISYYIYNRFGSLKWQDFKSKKERKIFECLSANLIGTKWGDIYIKDITKFGALDSDPESKGIITEGELENFLTVMKSDEKYSASFNDITVEDLKAFFDKMARLNPTDFEKNITSLKELGITNENGDEIVSKEMLARFSESSSEIPVCDKSGNVIKGFEIFDLNNDSKIDSVEAEYFFKSKNKVNINDISTLLQGLDNLGEPDRHVTDKERAELYSKLSAENQRRAEEKYKIDIGKLSNYELNSTFNANLVTPQIKNLFSNGVSEVSFDVMSDSKGNLKKGFELFDLNNDGKLDDVEKSFFITGGKMIKSDSNVLTLGSLLSSLRVLDYYDNKEDGKTDFFYRRAVYNYVQAAHFIIDELDEFNPEAKDAFIEQMSEIGDILHLSSDNALGMYSNPRGEKPSSIALANCYNKYDLAGTLLHELTHALLYKFSERRMSAIAQEVQTFFIKSKFMDYTREKFDDATYSLNDCYYINSDYHELRKKYPDIDDIDIAKALFVSNVFESYKETYHTTLSADKAIYKEKYYQIGNLFKRTKGKADIYKAGINSALSEIKLKYGDANGLNTYAIMMLFTPDKPIITASDLVDSRGYIKRGLELFDFDGNGKLSAEEAEKFKYIAYSDLPKIFDERMSAEQ